MWMCYAQASWTEPTDLISAVQRAKELFTLLSFEQSHSRVYDFGRYGTDEELKRLEDIYDAAELLCEKFLKGEINVNRLVSELDTMNLEEHTIDIKKFIKEKNDCEGKI